MGRAVVCGCGFLTPIQLKHLCCGWDPKVQRWFLHSSHFLTLWCHSSLSVAITTLTFTCLSLSLSHVCGGDRDIYGKKKKNPKYAITAASPFQTTLQFGCFLFLIYFQSHYLIIPLLILFNFRFLANQDYKHQQLSVCKLLF